MRALVTIPHYFQSEEGAAHGSLGHDAQARVWALAQCLRALHGTFGARQEHWVRKIDRLAPQPANQANQVELDVVICTTQGRRLLDQLPAPANLYREHATGAEPRLLGFECHAVLRDHLGAYDFYCYLEDDLILLDPSFFAKLAWFNRLAGDVCVLQPNRFEFAYTADQVRKVYIDFEFEAEAEVEEAQEQNRSGAAGGVIGGEALGQRIRFRRTSNPHAGCFFLNARQMATWAARPDFLDRSTSFVGPLESAATLGLARTFRVYKPAAENASFLEIQHYGQAWSQKLPRVRIPPRQA